MPRTVRNFWAQVTNPRRTVQTGGESILVTIYQRKDGGVTLPIVISGNPVGDTLRLDVEVHGKNVFSITTDR